MYQEKTDESGQVWVKKESYDEVVLIVKQFHKLLDVVTTTSAFLKISELKNNQRYYGKGKQND